MIASTGFVLADLIFPVFMMYFFPPLLGIIAAANLVIEAIVFFAALRFLNVKMKSQVGVLLGLWALGLVADMTGSLFLVFPLTIHNPLMNSLIDYYSIYSSPLTVILISVAILVAALIIYWLDLVVLRKRIPLSQARRIALIFAIVTAPYTYLIPTNWFYH